MIRQGSKFKVKWVNHRYTKSNSPFTTFSISDITKDGQGANKYVYYNVTVWNRHVDIADGDFITVVNIESVSTREYNGKVKNDLVLDVETGEAFTGAPKEEEFVTALEDSETALPFDL